MCVADQPSRSSYRKHFPEQQRHQRHDGLAQLSHAVGVLGKRPVRSIYGTLQMQPGTVSIYLYYPLSNSFVTIPMDRFRALREATAGAWSVPEPRGAPAGDDAYPCGDSHSLTIHTYLSYSYSIGNSFSDTSAVSGSVTRCLSR